MAIRIQQLADSTITAQAVAGGTLLPSTTYYVCCVFGMTSAWRDGDAHTYYTNEVSVVTTVTDLSIQVNWSHTLDIVSFADYGGGVVKVTVDGLHHNLRHGNSVTIAGTTNYNGDYTITYDWTDVDGVDAPNEFRITHSWDGDDATGTVMCDDDQIGSNYYISIRVSTTPLYVGGVPDPTNINIACWIGAGYGLPAAVQPYTITSQPTGNGTFSYYYMPYWRNAELPKSITRYDKPFVKIDGSENWADWRSALLAWLPENFSYQVATPSVAETWHFQGHIQLGTFTTSLIVSHVDFTIDGGFYAIDATHIFDYLTWRECLWRQIGPRRPQIAGTFERTAIRNECQDGAYMDKALITDHCGLYPLASYTFYGTASEQLDGATLVLNDDNRYFWYVYPRLGTRVQNLDVLIGYFYTYYTNYDSSVASDTHYMENINIYSTYDSSVWPRDLYIYQPTGNYIIEMLNVRAPLQTNGIVRCLRSHAANNTAKFYFSVTIHVVDKNGVDISGATVRLINKDGTVFTDTTDSNGDFSMNILSYENVPGDDVFGDYIYYFPFTLTVEEYGYQQYREEIDVLGDKREQVIALQPAVEYKEALINADVEEDVLTGTVVQDEVTGVLVTEVVTVDVEEDIIYGKTTEDIITGVTS